MNERNQNYKFTRRIVSSQSLDPIIDNGSLVQLGINPEGNLIVPGPPPNETTDVGVRFIPTNGEAVAVGALNEGWGGS